MRFDPCAEIEVSKAQSLIRDIVEGGEVILSNHAKESMKKRGYSTHDVEYILLNGKIVKKEFKKITQQWAYTVSGDDLDGDSGSVVIVIIKQYSGIVVTVLS
jgi:hypothetical protein